MASPYTYSLHCLILFSRFLFKSHATRKATHSHTSNLLIQHQVKNTRRHINPSQTWYNGQLQQTSNLIIAFHCADSCVIMMVSVRPSSVTNLTLSVNKDVICLWHILSPIVCKWLLQKNLVFHFFSLPLTGETLNSYI